jgi:NitT/TauT family transport system permease protein
MPAEKSLPAASQTPAQSHQGTRRSPSRWAIMIYRWKRALRQPTPYLMLLGLVLWFGAYYLFTEGWALPRFNKLPGPVKVVTEWFNPDPMWGVSVYTAEYYQHILYSCMRIAIGFGIATVLGVSVGLMMGWSKVFKDYTFPILETLRPIPILAWVPLAILMFTGTETPVIFLTTLASFYVTVLNTLLGVESIDKSYFRAAACLGSKRHHIFLHVVVPGAMPFIFTGLQISIGVAWFSLVAAEMVSGEYGLGYLIITSYVNVTYVTIVIGMVTLGIIGYITSAMIRKTGDLLMDWRVRTLGGR